MLEEKLIAWRSDMSIRTAPFKISAQGSEVRVNFSAIRAAADRDVTIFIEDTSEVQQQAQQLKLAELGRLSASIAHEVRNPLGAISHAAQLLEESDSLSSADERLVSMIVSHCERMNGVVENVLEMSRRRNPKPERMALKSFLERFLEDSQGSFVDAEISSEVAPESAVIRVDPNHLNQALTNLVDNALRFSAENNNGQRVLLQGGIETSTDRPYLNVIDYGKGVPLEQIPNLFQPFNTTRVGGTGLGLYISKELCDSNQAQLSYVPQADGGSCFRIFSPTLIEFPHDK